MRTAKVLSLIVLILVAGCGGSSGPSFAGIRFLLGDPSVSFYGHTLTFGAGGAPGDGRIEMLDGSVADELLQQAVADFTTVLFFLIAISQPDGLRTFDLQFDWTPQTLYTVGGGQAPGAVVKLGAAVTQKQDDTLVPAGVTHIHVGRGTSHVETMVDDPQGMGMADLGVDLDVQVLLDDPLAPLVNIKVTQSAASKYESRSVLVRLFLQETSVGSLEPGVAQTLEATLPLDPNSNQMLLDVRFESAGDFFSRDIEVCFDFDWPAPPPPPLEPRVHDIGTGNEGITPIRRSSVPLFYDGVEIGLGEFAFMLVGKSPLQVASSGPAGLVGIDSADAKGGSDDSTYRGVLVNYDPPTLVRPLGAAATAPVVGARIAVGSWGLSIANFDNTTQAFGDDVIVEVGNMTDVTPFDGDPGSGELVYVDNSADEIKFITRDAQNQFVIDPSSTLTNAAWDGASGAVVSAIRHSSGDLLFVTDGSPGELWVLPSGAATASLIGTVAGAPRTVRAEGNIAAVGSYGSGLGFGGIGLFVRSAGGTWGFAPFGFTGPRVVGLDVKHLADGRVAVAAPSFLDDSLVLLVLDGTTGEILDDQDLALPEACTGPGHCSFIRDEGTDAVFVSCNTSDNIVMMPVTHGP